MPVTTTSDAASGGFVHQALLYHGVLDLHAALCGFASEACDAREPVLVALASSRLAAARERLAGLEGEIAYADIESVGGNPACVLAAIQDWLHAHTGRGRVVCESVWPGRTGPETVECLRQEDVFNRALASEPATLMCPYDADGLDPATLEGARRTHPFLVEHGRRRVSSLYRGPGEADPDRSWPLDPTPPAAARYDLDAGLSTFREALITDPQIDALPDERRSDLVLAANEAATNAVQHGDGACVAAVWEDDDRVVVEIRSATPVPDPLAGCRTPDPDASSGRGLWLINQVCDLVQARTGPGGSVMRMHVRTPRPSRAV